ncbi:SEC-C metal-binding domain-containing protein [Lysobacter sp. CA199]|uniref:SEC-C metal-binding domain-containing protein n=1 Tax=Lysobacter sp. CA199 TaxID=3455608 RepID=UPI003F8D740B
MPVPSPHRGRTTGGALCNAVTLPSLAFEPLADRLIGADFDQADVNQAGFSRADFTQDDPTRTDSIQTGPATGLDAGPCRNDDASAAAVRTPAARFDELSIGSGSFDAEPRFETTRKRRKGYPSETRVKRGRRLVHGDKELVEKLGRNDPCPCGSARRFKELLSACRLVRGFRAGRLLP